MNTRSLALLSLILSAPWAAAARGEPPDIEHVVVYSEPGRSGGWPANHGIWSWGNEILVGFGAGYYRDPNVDEQAPRQYRAEVPLMARSQDGGRTWKIEDPADKGVLLAPREAQPGALPLKYIEPEPVECPGGIDFAHADFAMTCRLRDINKGVSRFYYSYDRGVSWKGPFLLPLFGQPGIAARTDYLVNGRDDCFVFLTATKSNNLQGRPICVRTRDGGKSWNLVSFVGPEPQGYAIMPSTVRQSGSDLLMAVRRSENRRCWIETWQSRDEARSWSLANDFVTDTGEKGNPPQLNKLADGRVCLTYGRRAKPFGIFARFSENEGKTWSEPLVLRDDGGGLDIGYARSVQRPDGWMVTVYRFWDEDTGRKPYIGATIWNPGREPVVRASSDQRTPSPRDKGQYRDK